MAGNPNYILNPATGRYVLRTGVTGRQVLSVQQNVPVSTVTAQLERLTIQPQQQPFQQQPFQQIVQQSIPQVSTSSDYILNPATGRLVLKTGKIGRQILSQQSSSSSTTTSSLPFNQQATQLTVLPSTQPINQSTIVPTIQPILHRSPRLSPRRVTDKYDEFINYLREQRLLRWYNLPTREAFNAEYAGIARVMAPNIPSYDDILEFGQDSGSITMKEYPPIEEFSSLFWKLSRDRIVNPHARPLYEWRELLLDEYEKDPSITTARLLDKFGIIEEMQRYLTRTTGVYLPPKTHINYSPATVLSMYKVISPDHNR